MCWSGARADEELEANRKLFTPDGRMLTGDVATLGAQGYLRVVVDELPRTSGGRIAVLPRVAEAAFRARYHHDDAAILRGAAREP